MNSNHAIGRNASRMRERLRGAVVTVTVAVGLIPGLCAAVPQYAAPVANPLGLTPVAPSMDLEFTNLDGDLDFDLYVGIVFGGVVRRQNGGNSTAPFFVPFSSPLDVNPHGITISIGSPVGGPTFGDLDGDGDLDLLCGGNYSHIFQRNTGSDVAPAFGPRSTNPFGLSSMPFQIAFPELVDIDGDGDLDLFSGDSAGNMHFFRNTASIGATTPAFAARVSNPFGLTNIPSYSYYGTYYGRAPMCFTHVDGDGDFDLYVGSSSGNIYFFDNTGTRSVPAFAPAAINPFGITNVGLNSGPDTVDIDGDGNLDLFVGSDNGYFCFENTIPQDTIPPASSATVGASVTKAASVPVNFTATDNQSPIVDVRLWAKTPGSSSFVNSGLTGLSGYAGTFNYSFSGGDGTYEFYTIARDFAFRVEAAPAVADCQILLDATGPVTSAHMGALYVTSPAINVDFTASDAGTGMASTQLWVKTPGSGSFVNTGLTENGTSGTFNYNASAGDGSYEFYTIGVDAIGNVEIAPASDDDSIILDTQPPTSSASIALSSTANATWDVNYTANEPTSDLDRVELWVKTPGTSSFVSTGLFRTLLNGTFNYTATGPDGVYEFYTIASDFPGNVETAPASADDSILLDRSAPGFEGEIVLLSPAETDDDVIGYEINFSAPVAPTFTESDLSLTGTLATASTLYFSEAPGDPDFSAFVVINDPDADGTIGLQISGAVEDGTGNSLAIPVNGPLCTISNFPAGDVNKDGVFNIADVALLADANLGLAVLP